MDKHTLQILRCEYRKILKVCLSIFQYYAWIGLTPFIPMLPFISMCFTILQQIIEINGNMGTKWIKLTTVTIYLIEKW